VDTPIVDPQTLAGDPVAHVTQKQAQEDLLRAAENALCWLENRRNHYPPQMRDGREGAHRKALREAIERVRRAS
jgi:hypothetical protein